MRRITLTSALALTTATGAAMASTSDFHAPWTDILQTYVVESQDGLNRFDYGALKANEADKAKLSAYIQSYATLDMDTLSDDAQFAAYSNAYNALTIEHMIERYPVKSIRSGYIVGPWKRVKMTIDGEELSLDAIEHDVLRVDWSDPRVHYAVNCASIGCPNLQTRAWVAETLDEDLDTAARDFVNHQRGVSVLDRGGLKVSRIYKWFREDFGGSDEGVIAHVLQYAEPDLAAEIRANADVKKHGYDWDLNDVE
ncbi:MAG: DUF547 domain-containing protein [Pseudomonadota bacterium]